MSPEIIELRQGKVAIVVGTESLKCITAIMIAASVSIPSQEVRTLAERLGGSLIAAECAIAMRRADDFETPSEAQKFGNDLMRQKLTAALKEKHAAHA